MDTAKTIREDYLHQNAFHDVDTYTSMEKQYKMLKLIYDFHRLSNEALEKDVEFNDIINLPVKEKIGRAKYVNEVEIDKLDNIGKEVNDSIKQLINGDSANV